ncbi:MAG: haloacid dehalogenase type II [Candidatus Velthaea sp.]
MSAAVVFDLYGTLLRIDALRDRAAAGGIAEAEAFVNAWRAKQIEFAWCSTLMNEYRDFDTLTRRALEYVSVAFGAALSRDELAALAAGWLDLAAHPDVPPALAQLERRGARLCVLTNGVRASAERALEAAGIRAAFEAVLSVEDAGAYKPDARVYRLATEHFGRAPRDIVFVSSNGWDATGAAAFGFRVAYCNRSHRPAETLGWPPETTIATLLEVDAFLG